MLKGSTIACGLAAVALAASAQAALLTFDLRATATSNGTISADKKTVNVAGPGTVTLGLYAVANNADGIASNDGIQAVQGSFMGTLAQGTVVGGLAGANVAPFTDPVAPSYAGDAANLNGDSVQDVGSLATSGGSGWFVGSAAAMQFGAEVLVGQATLTTTQFLSNSAADINFVLRNKKDGTIAARNTVIYQADGAAKAEGGLNADLAIGNAVRVQTVVPEPASLSLLGLGALGLLARRRQA